MRIERNCVDSQNWTKLERYVELTNIIEGREEGSGVKNEKISDS